MRITHVTDSYLPRLGGIEAQVHGLAIRQARAGHEVHVLTTTPREPGDHGQSTEHDGPLTVHRLAARLPMNLPVHPRGPQHFDALLARLRPDVAHLHSGIVAPVTQAMFGTLVRHRVPTVFTQHSVIGRYQGAFAALDRLTGWSRWPVLWTSVSEMAASPLRRVVGDRGQVWVLNNGVDLTEWQVPRTERTGRADTRVHAVAATRFMPRKRVLPMLHSCAAAVQQLPTDSLRVTIAGDGPQRAAATRFVERSGLDETVLFPGRLTREQLQDLYGQADIFLAPGVADSFSIGVLEAQAAGLAILCRSQSGAAERIEPEVSGLLAADDESFTAALVRLVREPDLLAAITDHNQAVPPTSGWPQVLAQVEAAYAEAIRITART
ncbi:glycosyltransferase family 4 protein [Ruania zhangjianzhongii]|uniref:glycosyltransferase family 4 protein n=1 Tax=Ruania zhangjianzhongii TaxID=2603206 RepID=UPI0011C7DCB4|nr:glycosyltransferase family 4 protein [Ruania zhangjianzhongii]